MCKDTGHQTRSKHNNYCKGMSSSEFSNVIEENMGGTRTALAFPIDDTMGVYIARVWIDGRHQRASYLKYGACKRFRERYLIDTGEKATLKGQGCLDTA